MPELPALEVALVPASHRYVSKKWQDCNWVQAMEGSIDTAHFSFAHLTFDKGEDEDLDIEQASAQPDLAHELRPRALDRRGPAPRHQGRCATPPASPSPAGASPPTTTSTGASPSS